VRWVGGEVLVKDSVRAPRPLSGEALRSSYFDTTATFTLGLVRFRDGALRLGPWELLRFGPPATGPQGVTWPIQSGLLAAGPGGRFEVGWRDGRLAATVDGYRPALPLPIYALTQLPFHHALVRLQLLRVRGRLPSAGVPADVSGRLAAAAIDAALCAGITLVLARKRRLKALVAIAAGYHVAAWSASGRTLGGAIMRQRVVAVDGSRPSLAQAALRFALLPLAALRMRAVHDEIAGTDVITD
jgi:RDD family